MPSSNEAFTKEKIAHKLHAEIGLPLSLCSTIVNCFFEEILTDLKKNDKLTISNFGQFRINHKKSRPGFNIKKSEAIEIPPQTVLRFIASRQLKEAINDNNADDQ